MGSGREDCDYCEGGENVNVRNYCSGCYEGVERGDFRWAFLTSDFGKLSASEGLIGRGVNRRRVNNFGGKKYIGKKRDVDDGYGGFAKPPK